MCDWERRDAVVAADVFVKRNSCMIGAKGRRRRARARRDGGKAQT